MYKNIFKIIVKTIGIIINYHTNTYIFDVNVLNTYCNFYMTIELSIHFVCSRFVNVLVDKIYFYFTNDLRDSSARTMFQ